VIDGLGHVRALVAPNGTITEVWHYDSWGNPISPPAQRIEQPFLWNGAYGYEYIPFTGLYHIGAREYDPRTARWLQRDPNKGSIKAPNSYIYCSSDPINFADQSGAAEDPGGPKGSIRYVINAFIPEKEITVWLPFPASFAGDARSSDPHGKGARLSIYITVQKKLDGTCEVHSPVVEVGETVGTGYMASGYRGFASPAVGSSVTNLSGGGKHIHVIATAGNPFYGELSNWSFPIVIDFSFVIDRYGRIHSLEGSHTWYPAFEMYAYWGEVGTPSHRFLPCYLYLPDG